MNDDMRRCRVLKLELIRREVELRPAGEQNPQQPQQQHLVIRCNIAQAA